MLRRRPDDTYELRLVEQALWSARPAPLSGARRDALRVRIMGALGYQRPADEPLLLRATERWVAIPAGVGILAAILAASKVALELRTSDFHSSANPTFTVVEPSSPAWPSSGSMADFEGWRSIGPGLAYGMEAGAEFRYARNESELTVDFVRGPLTLATDGTPITVRGPSWTANLAGGVRRSLPGGGRSTANYGD